MELNDFERASLSPEEGKENIPDTLQKIDTQIWSTLWLLINNIQNTRSALKSEWIRLFNDDIELKTSIDKKWTLLIETFNDNWILSNWDFFWEDVWKSFWFLWEYKRSDSISHIELTWYTHGLNRTKDNWWEQDTQRTDHLSVWHQEKVMSISPNARGKVDIYAGLWLQATWDLWLDNIQNTWHKATGAYLNNAEYESSGVDLWVDMRTTAEWKYDIVSVWDSSIYAFAVASWIIPIAGVGQESYKWEAWIWASLLWWLWWIEISRSIVYNKSPDNSVAMSNSNTEGANKYTNLKLSAWLTRDTGLYYKLKIADNAIWQFRDESNFSGGSASKKVNSFMEMWIKIDF